MESSRRQIVAVLVLVVGAVASTPGPAVFSDDEASPPDVLKFEDDILPIFKARCVQCHAGAEPKAGLNLTQPSALLKGGDNGAAVRIGAAEFSLLYEKIASNEMPATEVKLTAEEKGVIRKWINDGAAGVSNADTIGDDEGLTAEGLWSFQTPVRPRIPAVEARHRLANPIDAFVLAKLESEGLTLADEADRETLLRRASYDLLGLPPTPSDLDEFLADQRPGAVERMIDRLLASPNYGERWGRHWLDVVGYAESAGILNEDRPLPLAFRYRDYVIRAFNSDKPYDRFLQEQIAGDELTGYWTAYETMDELPPEVVEGITATGFLRTAADPSRPDFTTIKNAAGLYHYPTLFDTLQIVCSSTMGLTIQCARCHSHKYDPIPQPDYYRMQAVFMPALRPQEWVPQMERRLLIATKSQREAADQHNNEVDANIKALREQLAVWESDAAVKLYAARLADLPEEIRNDVDAALNTPEEKRTDVQKYLTEKFTTKLKPSGDELATALKQEIDGYQPEVDRLNGAISAEERRRRHFDEIRALYDLEGEVTTPVLLRGDPLTPGPPVEPGVISTLETPESFEWSPTENEERSSGRRLAFARWLTQPGHPLTARVFVNRVWMHHFGKGIVATPEDFGVLGASPTHPELLDWLAVEFVESGWSIKQLHRLILTSSTWRQRSRVDEVRRSAAEAVDPENRLLWRQELRRLDAEPLRDAFLAASGLLDDPMYGPSQAVQRNGDGEVVVSSPLGARRRSVYLSILRLNPETLLQAFDQPEMSINCTQRSVSTVATQALTLLNSDQMVGAAEAFAQRVAREAADDPVRFAVRIAFARDVTPDEQTLLTEFLTAQTEQYRSQSKPDQPVDDAAARHAALADLCHMLLTANEFAYID